MRWSSWTLVCALAVVSTTAFAGNDKQHATKKEPAKAAPPAAGSAADGSADEAPPSPEAQADAVGPNIKGPKLVDLGHGAEIQLPEKMVLFEKPTAQAIMRKSGDDGDSVVAVITPLDPAQRWEVVIDADDSGYVNDSESDDLDANQLFEQYKQGNVEQNKERAKLGIGPLYLDDWNQQPKYDKAKHHLVWGLNAHTDKRKVVNFFTRFLGRGGYLSVDLIDGATTIEQSKVQAMSILDALRFKPGQRYEDHASGDKDSHIGLKALMIGGGALFVAKKTGLLVLLFVFLKKGAIILVAGIAGFFKWLTGKGKKTTDLAMNPPPSDPPPPTSGV